MAEPQETQPVDNGATIEFDGGHAPTGRLGVFLAAALAASIAALGLWQFVVAGWWPAAIGMIVALGLAGVAKGLRSGTTVRGDEQALSVGFTGGAMRSISVDELVEVYIGAGVDADEVRLKTHRGDALEFSLSMMDVRAMPQFIAYLAQVSTCAIGADKRFLELVPPSRRPGVQPAR